MNLEGSSFYDVLFYWLVAGLFVCRCEEERQVVV